MNVVKIAPSILAADFAYLADSVARVAGEAECCTSTAWTATTCRTSRSARRWSRRCVRTPTSSSTATSWSTTRAACSTSFAEAGADGITVHVELGDPRPLLDEIASLGVQRGLALEPETPFDAVEPYLDVDRPAARDERAHRVRRSALHPRGARQGARGAQGDRRTGTRRRDRDRRWHQGRQRGARAVEAGVDILVSGTGIFGADDPAAAARAIRNASS